MPVDVSDRGRAALALLSGSGATIARSLAPGVEAWMADQDQGRRGEVCALSGADAVGSALERLGPATPVLETVAGGPECCWAEITRLNETCCVRYAVEPGGRVRHLLLLRGPAVPSPPVGDSTAAAPGRAIVERYFDALMNSRFEDAASHFTSDTIYFHPPYGDTNEWVLFRGRDALLEGWLTLRGPSPARQIVTGFWQTDKQFFMEGVVEGIPNGGSFFATGRLTDGGEISRYVAFYSATRIPGPTDLNTFLK